MKPRLVFYQYSCKSCRYDEEIPEEDARQVVKDCPDCGEHTFRKGIRIKRHQQAMPCKLHRRICIECGHTGQSAFDANNRDEKKPIDCPECGAEQSYVHAPIAGIGRFSEQFPYYDHGMGMVLTSKKHRRAEMKKRGLIEAPDLDFTIDAFMRAHDDQTRKEDAEFDKYMDRVENAPAFSDYRQARDKGQVDDITTKLNDAA